MKFFSVTRAQFKKVHEKYLSYYKSVFDNWKIKCIRIILSDENWAAVENRAFPIFESLSKSNLQISSDISFRKAAEQNRCPRRKWMRSGLWSSVLSRTGEHNPPSQTGQAAGSSIRFHQRANHLITRMAVLASDSPYSNPFLWSLT